MRYFNFRVKNQSDWGADKFSKLHLLTLSRPHFKLTFSTKHFVCMSIINTIQRFWAVKLLNGSLAKYEKLQVAHAAGMPGTFSPPPRVSDPDMLHGTCVTHMSCCMPRSLISGFLWSRWRGKRSRHSRCTRNPHFYVSRKRPMALIRRMSFYLPQLVSDFFSQLQQWSSVSLMTHLRCDGCIFTDFPNNISC